MKVVVRQHDVAARVHLEDEVEGALLGAKREHHDAIDAELLDVLEATLLDVLPETMRIQVEAASSIFRQVPC